jgi:hypothetical protein
MLSDICSTLPRAPRVLSSADNIQHGTAIINIQIESFRMTAGLKFTRLQRGRPRRRAAWRFDQGRVILNYGFFLK